MDKYALVLHLCEHPEEYTADEVRHILSDPEARQIYDAMCLAGMAAQPSAPPDIDAEWGKFKASIQASAARARTRRRGRAAAVIAVAISSVAAVALGVAVSVHRQGTPAVVSAPAAHSPQQSERVACESAASEPDTLGREVEPVVFENAPLATILERIAATHGLEVRFRNKAMAQLHLYYRFDPSKPLDKTLAQLNTFEQISIRREGNVLIIE